MKTIKCWNDLAKFGIVPLTGEACGLNYRILFDVTEPGRKILARCFGVPELKLADAWGRQVVRLQEGDGPESPVGSIMMSQEMLVPVGVFALLESGCSECWLYSNHSLLGIEPSDSAERIEMSRKMCPEALVRQFAYCGTAGDRNLHMMSGRVE